ncbi:MAG: VOC family protein [Bryobacterales bacterium]|nr:VOC family protein [Bryobacterales bacterium]MDE0628840.1 VOC family protein [Bryobacterales bacterium]
MTGIRRATFVLAAAAAAALGPGAAQAAELHHIRIIAASPSEAVRWYVRHLDCSPLADRNDATDCQGVELMFWARPTMGSTQGTGVDHIAFSYADVDAKMAELEAVGVRGSGVRLQRFDGGETLRDQPGLFRHGFIFDPWGTRIELLEDPDRQGFHQVHLSSSDPAATLAWYRKVFGGKPARLRGRKEGLLLGDIWLLADAHPSGRPAPTSGRAISHIAFSVPDLANAAPAMRRKGLELEGEPAVPRNGRTDARQVFALGPDSVTIAAVEPGFAGVEAEAGAVADGRDAEPYKAPRTPWGEPDLQGVWTGNSAHGIPLERPPDLAGVESLTAEQAAARRERGTLGSIWGYEREWRDTTLGYDKMTPSRQVAMIVDPPDGRLPALTPEGGRRAEEAARERRRKAARPPVGPEDLTPYVRCITRGLPGMMMPGIYNNGLQIVQGPGFVAIQKEMIHETRAIPTRQREPLDERLQSWLGDSQGRWEGDTLVIETRRFNGRSPYRGTSEGMELTERFTRIGPARLAYEFTVNDPAVWVRPWTATFAFDLDDAQYELVEYACHEGNYGMFNILSGARARDREAARAAGQAGGSQ